MGGVGMGPAPHRLCSNRNPHWEEQGTDLEQCGGNIIPEFQVAGHLRTKVAAPRQKSSRATEQSQPESTIGRNRTYCATGRVPRIASYVMPIFGAGGLT
jgi:hypothetical protein